MREVARARAHLQVPEALLFGLHADGAVAALGGRLSRAVLDGVLRADVLRNLVGDLVHIVERVRKVRRSAGLLGELGQHLLGVPRLGMAHIRTEEQADAVDRRPVQVLNAADGLLQGRTGGVVVAVGDDQQHLLAALGALGQVVRRGDDSVIQRRSAAGLDVVETLLQLGNAVGEVLVDVGLGAEVHQKGLILRIGELHQVQRRRIHRRTLVVHRAGAVDQNSQRNGQVLMPEAANLLGHTVLKDAEGSLRQ